MNLFWSHVLKIACYLPSSIVISYMLARILRVERKGVYILTLNVIEISVYVLYAVFAAYPFMKVFNTVGQIGSYALFALAVRRESLPRRILAFALVLLTFASAEALCALFFTLGGGAITETQFALAAQQPVFYLFIQSVNFAATTLICFILIQFWERLVLHTKLQVLWYYVLFPLSQAMLLCIASLLISIKGLSVKLYLLLSIGVLFCVAVDTLLFRSMHQLTEKAVAEERAAWSESLLLQQEAHYAQMIADTEDASRIRHDIRSQLQTAYALMARGDTESAGEQLDGMVSRLERKQTFCAHRVVNAVLSVKAGRFADAHIPFQCDCDVPQELPFDGVELCSLFSNVLDNAYHAASACEEKSAAVELTAACRQGYFILSCSNPAQPGDTKLKPRKGHGLGLTILEDLARRHDGRLEAKQDAGQFRTTVWLRLPEPKEVS